MRTLLTIGLLAGMIPLAAQTRKLMVSPVLTFKATRGDTVVQQLRDLLLRQQRPAIIDNMPNAINVQTAPLVYKDNNGQGFDIYESQQDGMRVLMPDSANKASLQKGGAVQVPQSFYQLLPKPRYRFPGEKRLFSVPGKINRWPFINNRLLFPCNDDHPGRLVQIVSP